MSGDDYDDYWPYWDIHSSLCRYCRQCYFCVRDTSKCWARDDGPHELGDIDDDA